MRAYEISEGFRDWFKKEKKSGPQPMNYADIEMIQSVDRKAKDELNYHGEDRQVYNLKSHHNNTRFVYVKYPNNFEMRIYIPSVIAKGFKFRTASELHRIFHKVNEMLQKENGT